MTIGQALAQLDDEKFNTVPQSRKIQWLSRLDQLVAEQIFGRYAEAAVEFAGYDADTPLDTQLLVGAPFDEIYQYWLESRVDYANGEFGQFNNANAMYEAVRQRFADHYHRTHIPVSAGVFRG